jgi:hypothetical protein
LNRRNRIDNDLREFCFQFARSSEAGASRERILNRSHDLGMLMPQNVWPPGTDEIDQLVAVDVEQVRPFAPINGLPPTAPKARAGLFTPPGMMFCASSKCWTLFSRLIVMSFPSRCRCIGRSELTKRHGKEKSDQRVSHNSDGSDDARDQVASEAQRQFHRVQYLTAF